jgi:hypothetical protein
MVTGGENTAVGWVVQVGGISIVVPAISAESELSGGGSGTPTSGSSVHAAAVPINNNNSHFIERCMNTRTTFMDSEEGWQPGLQVATRGGRAPFYQGISSAGLAINFL